VSSHKDGLLRHDECRLYLAGSVFQESCRRKKEGCDEMLRYISNCARRTTIVTAPPKQTGPRANPYYTAQISVTEWNSQLLLIHNSCWDVSPERHWLAALLAEHLEQQLVTGWQSATTGDKRAWRAERWWLGERRCSKCHPVPPIAVRDKTALQSLFSIFPKRDMLWVKYLHGDVRGLGNVPLSGTRFHAPLRLPDGTSHARAISRTPAKTLRQRVSIRAVLDHRLCLPSK
jgi:hypothetical protein